MAVSESQHRIVSLKGRLTTDVKFGGGLFATLKSGGTFDVERRGDPGRRSGRLRKPTFISMDMPCSSGASANRKMSRKRSSISLRATFRFSRRRKSWIQQGQ